MPEHTETEWDCGPHANVWNGHDARCRQVPAPSFAVTPEDLSYAPGTLLRDAAGRYWLVRDDGQTAAGTNGGVMVDLRRGDPVYRHGSTSGGVDRG